MSDTASTVKFPRGRMPKETREVLEADNGVTKEMLVCPRHGLWLKEFPTESLEDAQCQGCLQEAVMDAMQDSDVPWVQ